MSDERPSAPTPAAASPATKAPFHVSVAARCDVGIVRTNNEDAFVVADLTDGTLIENGAHGRFEAGDRGVLLAVSDGMGGAQAGEVASALVVDTLTRAMKEASAALPHEALLEDAVQRAHRAVWDAAADDDTKMGATLTAVFIHAGEAFIAEVGDSRAYLVRAGEICRLTRDQSMVQMLVDSGLMEPAQAERSSIRHVILQAMGHQPNVKVALGKLELRDRDCIVLCSDGLTGHVQDDEIRDVVLDSGRPEISATELVALANARGGEDNITVVVAGVAGSLSRPPPGETIDDTFKVLSTFEARDTPKRR